MSDLADLSIPEGVDCAKAQGLIQWLVKFEADNEKTQKYSDSEMTYRIMIKIQDEVK